MFYIYKYGGFALCLSHIATALCLHGVGATYLWKEAEQTLPFQRLLQPSWLDNPGK